MLSEQIRCTACGAVIQPSTAEKTGGLCMPCANPPTPEQAAAAETRRRPVHERYRRISKWRRGTIERVASGENWLRVPEIIFMLLPWSVFMIHYKWFFFWIRKPEELDLFVEEFDWDGDYWPLYALIRHRRCEKATALKLYWKLDPHFYAEYASREELSEWMEDAWDLKVELEKGFAEERFKVGRLSFDPKSDDDGYDWTKLHPNTNPEDIKVPLPAVVFEAVEGSG